MLNTFKKTLMAIGAATALSASMSANATIIDGIDFGVLGGAPFFQHFETASLAQTFINANNQTAYQYGEITQVNGAANYGVSGQRLYYTAEFSPSVVTLTGNSAQPINISFASGTINVYLANASLGNLLINPLGSGNPLAPAAGTNLALIQGLTPWVKFTENGETLAEGNLLGDATVSLIGGNTRGLFDVDLSGTFGNAAVAAFFDGNSIAADQLDPSYSGNPFADISVNASFDNLISRLNLNDPNVLTTCRNGTATNLDWCFGGTANIAGVTNPVPEPASIALLGLGLLGFGRKFRRA